MQPGQVGLGLERPAQAARTDALADHAVVDERVDALPAERLARVSLEATGAGTQQEGGRRTPSGQVYTDGWPAVSGPSGGGGSVTSGKRGPATSSDAARLPDKRPSTVSQRRLLVAGELVVVGDWTCTGDEGVEPCAPAGLVDDDDVETASAGDEVPTSSDPSGERVIAGARPSASLPSSPKTRTGPPSGSLWRVPSGVPGALGAGLLAGEKSGLGDGVRRWPTGAVTNLQKVAIARKQYLAGVVIE